MTGRGRCRRSGPRCGAAPRPPPTPRPPGARAFRSAAGTRTGPRPPDARGPASRARAGPRRSAWPRHASPVRAGGGRAAGRAPRGRPRASGAAGGHCSRSRSGPRRRGDTAHPLPGRTHPPTSRGRRSPAGRREAGEPRAARTAPTCPRSATGRRLLRGCAGSGPRDRWPGRESRCPAVPFRLRSVRRPRPRSGPPRHCPTGASRAEPSAPQGRCRAPRRVAC